MRNPSQGISKVRNWPETYSKSPESWSGTSKANERVSAVSWITSATTSSWKRVGSGLLMEAEPNACGDRKATRPRSAAGTM
jgi:hypothetical protein